MSFYTALTGLKGAQTDISTTSNNIANVGSNGFKKSRAEFGDIFGSTPLQAKTVGVGTVTKSITQQFSQYFRFSKHIRYGNFRPGLFCHGGWWEFLTDSLHTKRRI